MDWGWRVNRSVFQVVERAGGWGLLDDDKPIFWFPERDSALGAAKVMADARHKFDGKPMCVQALARKGPRLIFKTHGSQKPRATVFAISCTGSGGSR